MARGSRSITEDNRRSLLCRLAYFRSAWLRLGGGELLGSLHAQTAVRADPLALLAPFFDHYPALPQGVEHLTPETFPAELVVEALMLSSGRTPSEHVAFGSCLSRSARFHVAILPGTARIDMERLDSGFLQPLSQEVSNELGPVVRPDGARCSVLADDLLHHLAHLLRANVAMFDPHPHLPRLLGLQEARPEKGTS